MTGKGTNLGASVTARLLNRAKNSGDDFQTVLTNFALSASYAATEQVPTRG